MKLHECWSRNSSVCTATGYGLGDRRVELRLHAFLTLEGDVRDEHHAPAHSYPIKEDDCAYMSIFRLTVLLRIRGGVTNNYGFQIS
jgi:hypothetical protein